MALHVLEARLSHGLLQRVEVVLQGGGEAAHAAQVIATVTWQIGCAWGPRRRSPSRQERCAAAHNGGSWVKRVKQIKRTSSVQGSVAFISVATAGGMLRPAELQRGMGRCRWGGDVARSQVMRWHAPASLQPVQEAAQITQRCIHHQPHISRTTQHPPVGVDVHKGQDAAGAQQALALLDLQGVSTQH